MRAQDNFGQYPEGSGLVDTNGQVQWYEVIVPEQTQRTVLMSGLGSVATFSPNPTGSPASPFIWRSPREISAFIDGTEITIPFDTQFRPHPKGGVVVEAIDRENKMLATVRMKMGQAGLCLGRFSDKEKTDATVVATNVAALDPALAS